MTDIIINKCTDAGAWYHEHVGKTFPISRHEVLRNPSQGIPEDVFWVRTGDAYNTLNYVRASDASVVGVVTLKTIPDPHPYVLLKRGLFWRPGDMGYTAKIAEAGRYTEAEAKARAHDDGEPVTMRLAVDFERSPEEQIAQLRQQLESAQAESKRLTDIRKYIAGVWEATFAGSFPRRNWELIYLRFSTLMEYIKTNDEAGQNKQNWMLVRPSDMPVLHEIAQLRAANEEKDRTIAGLKARVEMDQISIRNNDRDSKEFYQRAIASEKDCDSLRAQLTSLTAERDALAVENTQAMGTIHRLQRDNQTYENAIKLAIEQRDKAQARADLGDRAVADTKRLDFLATQQIELIPHGDYASSLSVWVYFANEKKQHESLIQGYSNDGWPWKKVPISEPERLRKVLDAAIAYAEAEAAHRKANSQTEGPR